MPHPIATELPGPPSTRFGTIHWFEEIDSTNRYLLDAARDGAPDGTVAVADGQTAGRGRLGRTWQAPPRASLLVSVLLRPTVPVESWPLLLVPGGLAAVSTLATLCDVAGQLKWPNDVVVGDRKIAGMLAEASGDAIVVGMGLNLDWPELPADIAETATAVSLLGGRLQPRRVVLDTWLRRFDAGLRVLESGPSGLASLQHLQRSRSATIGRRVRVERLNDVVVGTAIDIAADGNIVVRRDDGPVEAFGAGDVVHLRPHD